MLNLLIAGLLAAAAPTATEVTLGAEHAALHGTMLAPDGETRAVALILPGSGPTDRDGNSPMGVSGSTYRLLADALAADGVATVRIDKRGIGGSMAASPPESELRFTTYVEDARAWAADTVTRTGLPCVWLIGHSEGAQIALAAVEGGNDAVCGVVLLSGAGRSASVILREQLNAGLPEPLKTQAFAVLSELEAGRTVADSPPQLAVLFRPSVQPYLISWLPVDPAALAAAYDGPMLIVQGDNDLQVAVTDAQTLAAAQPRARLTLLQGVNHLLKSAPTDRAGNAATYADPALPLAPGVAEAVAGFILDPR